MPSMTDYVVLSDGSFELDTVPASGSSDEKILTFDLPSDFTVGTNLAKPLLAYIINFVSDDGAVGIWINPEFPLRQTTRDHNLTWNNAHHADSGLWEAILGTKLKAGAQNKIVFNLDSGRVRFRDVVLWYQRGTGA